MIDFDVLIAIGCHKDRASIWGPHITNAMDRFDINTPARAAMFLAQCAHESAGFTQIEERLNYSAERLLQVFPKYFDESSARLCAGKPEMIANRVYANRMGNGLVWSGDGWKYRGRGLIQLTGRAMYRACGEGLWLMLEEHPEMLEKPEFAAASAAWYWNMRQLNAKADAGDIETATRAINGGLSGLEDRRWRWEKAKFVLGV